MDHGVRYCICNRNIIKPTGEKSLYFQCEIGVYFYSHSSSYFFNIGKDPNSPAEVKIQDFSFCRRVERGQLDPTGPCCVQFLKMGTKLRSSLQGQQNTAGSLEMPFCSKKINCFMYVILLTSLFISVAWGYWPVARSASCSFDSCWHTKV